MGFWTLFWDTVLYLYICTKLGKDRPWGFGFGYGVSWVSFILLFGSLVLLLCDRESEEIFYKEKQVEEGDEDEEEEE